MKNRILLSGLACLLVFSSVLALPCAALAETGQTWRYSGQLSLWGGFTPDVEVKFRLGARYLPQLNLRFDYENSKSLDFELSGNLNADLALAAHDEQAQAQAKPYRAWGRYSWATGEVRIGLQKLNFGSAQMLRPLMWFDSLDPRDPLQLTNGVWGGLYRQYFGNNANLWLWALVGNDGVKGWEAFPTSGKYQPEFGGRYQFPLPFGEAALTYHYRRADVSSQFPEVGSSPEHRFGIDLRADVKLGLWAEAVFTRFSKDLGSFSNQLLLTLGADYTFGVGNGLAVTAEHLLYANGPGLFNYDQALNVSAVNFNYPLGLMDSLTAMFYYVWGHNQVLSSLSWQRQYDDFGFYVTAFWNPVVADLPGGFGGGAMSGKGVQVMLVWNH